MPLEYLQRSFFPSLCKNLYANVAFLERQIRSCVKNAQFDFFFT